MNRTSAHLATKPDEIAAELARLLGGQWRVGSPAVRSHSTLFHADRIDAPSEKLLIKSAYGFLERPEALVELHQEVAALKRVATLFPQSDMDFGVPAVRAESAAGWVALEFVQGRSFAEVLLRSDASAQKNLMQKLGRYLRRLHEAFEYQPDATISWQALTERMIQVDQNRLPRCARTALDTLRAEQADETTIRIPASLAHGDAKLENFIVDAEGKIYGIDFQLANHGPVTFDLTRLLNRFEMWTSTHHALKLYRRRRSLSNDLLDGYGWLGEAKARRDFSKLRLASAVGLMDDIVVTGMQGARRTLRYHVEHARCTRLIQTLQRGLGPVPSRNDLTAAPSKTNNNKSARKGLMYLFAEGNISVVLQIVGMAVIARLLSPEQQGAFAVAGAIAAVASTVRDFGAAEYLIQKKQATEEDFRRTFAFNLIASYSIGLLILLSSSTVARFYGNADTEKILWILSVNFFLIPFGAVTMAWHRREMNFAPTFWSGLLSNLTAWIVCIACAVAGLGAFSLAWSALAGVIVSVSVAAYFRIPNMKRTPLFTGLGDVFKFGKQVVGIYVVGQAGKSAPELIIGRLLSLPSVAFFSRGGSLYEIFSRLVVRVVSQLCLPYFASALRDENSLRTPYIRAVSYIAYIGWPFLAFTAFFSEEVILILYGDQWSRATFVAKLICVAGAIEIVHIYSKEALIAVGRPDRGNVLQWSTQMVRVLGIVAGTFWGLTGVGIGLVVASLVSTMLAQRELIKYTEVPASNVVRALAQPFIATLVLIVFLVATHSFVVRFVSPTVALFIVGGLFCAAWFVVGLAQQHPLVQEIHSILRRVLRLSKG